MYLMVFVTIYSAVFNGLIATIPSQNEQNIFQLLSHRPQDPWLESNPSNLQFLNLRHVTLKISAFEEP